MHNNAITDGRRDISSPYVTFKPLAFFPQRSSAIRMASDLELYREKMAIFIPLAYTAYTIKDEEIVEHQLLR